MRRSVVPLKITQLSIANTFNLCICSKNGVIVVIECLM